MPRYPIPTDWDGTTFACVIIEWPDSEQWFGLLRGLITTPTRGRFWDERTGTIKDIQAVGLEIEERNPVASCDEWLVQLTRLADAVESLDVSSDLQVSIQTNIENNINVVATAIADSLATQSGLLVANASSNASAMANSFAWSNAMATNTLGVQIINNTPAQFRPIEVGVDSPPQAAEATPTGITATLQSTTPSEICKRSYWLVRNAKDFFNYLEDQRQSLATTTLGLMGLVADGLFVAGVRAEPASRAFLIPAAAILGFVHNLLTLYRENLDPLADLNDWMNNRYEDVVCALANGVEDLDDTETLRAMVLASATSFGLSPSVASLALIMFNYSSLAALYYVAPLLDPAPAIPAFERADICTFCGA